MKTLLKSLGISILVLLLLAVGYAGALWAGWLPIPSFVTAGIAKAEGLTPLQARTLDRVVNTWHVVRTSPDAPVVDQALALAAKTTDRKEWAAFARKAWPTLSPSTLKAVRDQLGIQAADWDALKALVDRQMTVIDQTGSFALTAAEAAKINALDQAYGFSELMKALGEGDAVQLSVGDDQPITITQ